MVATRRSMSPAPARGRAKSPARPKRAASPAGKKKARGKKAPFVLLDPKRMPFWLYAPNLLGYIRVATLVYAMGEQYRGSSVAGACLALSLAIDYLDGPCARHFDMCTQFGDILDHVCDHITMLWLVHCTTNSEVDRAVNALHCGVALAYMAYTGHYFKHASTSNQVTAIVEANNYFNMPSILWNANTCVVPLVKMSYHAAFGIGLRASTPLLDIVNYLGLLVTAAYTAACVHGAMQQ